MLGAFAACGSDDAVEEETWSCDAEHDGWERCDAGDIIWCHASGTSHFHSGAKCSTGGYACTQTSPSVAVCTSTVTGCTDGERRCEGNVAVQCEGGYLGYTPCGTRKTCLVDDAAEVATCWDSRPDAPCGGHGDQYESGCVCDQGYVIDATGDTCVAG